MNRSTINAAILNTLATTMTLDLAVAPMIVGRVPGIGVATTISGVAKSLGYAFIELRTDLMSAMDVSNTKRLSAGVVVDVDLHPIALRGVIQGKSPAIVMLSMDNVNVEVVDTLARVVIAHATTETILVFNGPVDAVEACQQIVDNTMGIHRALVPTAVIGAKDRPRQLQLVGIIEDIGCKRGERYMQLDLSEPYDHQVRFTVEAKDDQDDNALVDAMGPLYMHTDKTGSMNLATVAVLLTVRDGELVCTTDDMVVIG